MSNENFYPKIKCVYSSKKEQKREHSNSPQPGTSNLSECSSLKIIKSPIFDDHEISGNKDMSRDNISDFHISP